MKRIVTRFIICSIGITICVSFMIATYCVFFDPTNNHVNLIHWGTLGGLSVLFFFYIIYTAFKESEDEDDDWEYTRYLEKKLDSFQPDNSPKPKDSQARINEPTFDSIDNSSMDDPINDAMTFPMDDSINDNDKNIIDNTLEENENQNIIALMLKNAQETTEYFSISKSQAKISFMISVCSCIIGLFFLLGAVALSIYNQNITAAIIAAISGAIAELISATVFWIHNKSALQLNRYYNSLHENEKFLAAVNLVGEINKKKRDDVYIKIINQQLNIKETENSNEYWI